MSHGINSTPGVTAGTVSPVSSAAILWDASFSQHKLALRSVDKSLAAIPQTDLTYGRTIETLEKLTRASKSKSIPKCLVRLKPTLDHLLGFSSAISTMAQVQANPVSLIWGSIEILLKTAVHFVSTFEIVTDMLDNLTSVMLRMSRYLSLLPKSQLLRNCVCNVLSDYVGFCIDAIKFHKNLSWHTIIKFVWKPMDEKFKQTKSRIECRIQDFENEARITIDETTVRGIENIETRLQIAEAPLMPKKPVFHVDFSQNDFFTGRGEELGKLHAMFEASREKNGRCVCTVHGLGGVGKTQLALEYAYRHQADFQYVFWLPAEYGPRLAQRFADIASTVLRHSPQERQTTDLAAAVQASKDWLSDTDHAWLLIYDNVESWESIKPYWPSGRKGSIMITSQSSELVQISGGREVSLTPLNPRDGATLLLRQLRKSSEDTTEKDSKIAEEIARSLGGLPVAISHSAGYIEKSQGTLEEFMTVYERGREGSRKIWIQDCSPWTNQYHQTLETTWDIALAELPSEVRSLIDVLAMLDSEAIPEDMLFANTGYSKNDWSRESISSLGKRWLVRRQVASDHAFWSIHRALQQSLLHRLDTNQSVRQCTFETALALVRAAFPRHSSVQAPSNDKWNASEALLAHVLHLEKVYRSSPPGLYAPFTFAELLTDVGNYLWERGLYQQGIISLQTALRVHDLLKEEHLMEESKVCTLLAGIYLELGTSERKAAVDLCLKSWHLRDKYVKLCTRKGIALTEEEVVLFGNSWNDIACLLLEHGCYEGVEIALQKSLDVKRDRQIPEDAWAAFNYAENYKNLGILRTAEGKHEEAIALSAKATQLIEQEMGGDGPAAQSFRFHLAWALYQGGKLDEALEEHDWVRKARAKTFGEKAVHTLNSYFACAVVLHSMGQLDLAEQMLMHCLSVDTDQNWTSDYLPRVKIRLALVWDDGRNNRDKAQSLKREAESIREGYSYAHPFVLVAGREPANVVIYDHMAPVEGGRSTTGQLRTSIRNMPPIAEILRL